jgi:hypothetical protein
MAEGVNNTVVIRGPVHLSEADQTRKQYSEWENVLFSAEKKPWVRDPVVAPICDVRKGEAVSPAIRCEEDGHPTAGRLLFRRPMLLHLFEQRCDGVLLKRIPDMHVINIEAVFRLNSPENSIYFPQRPKFTAQWLHDHAKIQLLAALFAWSQSGREFEELYGKRNG